MLLISDNNIDTVISIATTKRSREKEQRFNNLKKYIFFTRNSANMKSNKEYLTHYEETSQNTSQTSTSGTTGPSSFHMANAERVIEMEDGRDDIKTGSCVDQGADNLEPPQALYTAGESIPRTGEPLHHTTWPNRQVLGGRGKKGSHTIKHR